MQFNPPPNSGWPPPDPSWPPQQPAWPAWGGGAAPPPGPYPPGYPPASPPGYPGANPTGYPPAPPPGYPGGYPPPFPGPQPPKSPNGLWLGLVGVLAVLVLVAGSVWYFSGTHGSTTASGGTGHSQKHDITTLTKDLLLGRSQFAGFDGDKWDSDVDVDPAGTDASASGSDVTVSPKECGDLEAGTMKTGSSITQSAGSALSSEGTTDMRATLAALAITSTKIDPSEYLRKCQEYTTSFGSSGSESLTMTTRVRSLNLSGLPRWAIAYSAETEAPPMPDGVPLSGSQILSVQGYYRGVLVHIGHFAMSRTAIDTSAMGDKLATLFNAQVAKLEAAP